MVQARLAGEQRSPEASVWTEGGGAGRDLLEGKTNLMENGSLPMHIFYNSHSLFFFVLPSNMGACQYNAASASPLLYNSKVAQDPLQQVNPLTITFFVTVLNLIHTFEP